MSTPLLAYIDAWRANDPERIADAVTGSCEIVESFGPVYRGRGRIAQWAQLWVAGGGLVHAWDVYGHEVDGRREVAQWRFDYTWDGRRRAFEGCTLARAEDERIAWLREYATTAELYEWTGAWR